MLKHIKFIDNHGSFCVNRPENTSYLYFPLASEAGLKSSVTPVLGGDSKIDQDTFLLEPVSSENLHNNRSSRNFWIVKEGHIPYSVTGSSAQQEADRFTDRQEDSELTAGFMWQTLKRTSRELGLISTVTSFIPKSDNVEIMYVTVENQTDTVQKFTAYGAIPVYGRSADNIRDHRNVTSMLHRIETTEHGINVCPTMSFDERGHQPNHKIYYVNGCSGKGENPISYYPTVEDFIGDDSVAMVLGDNIFHGHGLKKRLLRAANKKEGATVFGYYVDDPERFGIVEFDSDGKAISIEEKPEKPKSNYCVTGLYFYDNNVVKYAKELKPSARGELEITDLNKIYLEKGELDVELLGQGFTWLDTGTHESLVEATNFVKTVETHQHRKIACLEEIAYLNHWITKDQLLTDIEPLKKNQYGQYLMDVMAGKFLDK